MKMETMVKSRELGTFHQHKRTVVTPDTIGSVGSPTGMMDLSSADTYLVYWEYKTANSFRYCRSTLTYRASGWLFRICLTCTPNLTRNRPVWRSGEVENRFFCQNWYRIHSSEGTGFFSPGKFFSSLSEIRSRM